MATSVALGIVTALLLVAQAWLLASLLARAFTGELPGQAALIALLGVVLARALAAWLSEATAARCSANVKSELRSMLLARAATDGTGSTAAVATLATRGIDALDGYFSLYLPQLVLAVLVPPTVVVVLVARDWISAAIVIATLPLIPVFMALVGASTREQMDRQVRSLQRLGGHFLDVVAGLATLKVFGRAKAQIAAVQRVTDDYRVNAMTALRTSFLSSLVLELLATFSMALVAVAVGIRLLGAHMELETALLVLVLAPEAYLPLRRLGTSYHAGAEGAAAATQILERLDAPAPWRGTRNDLPDPAAHPLTAEGLRMSYPGRGAAVLDGVSLTVAPGESVAITGPSGAGKTTLLHVLLGLAQPEAGTVRLGGADLREFEPSAWHERVAWVPQRPHLFAGTIAENVRLGRPDASPESVWRALGDVRLTEAVSRLPEGLDTLLGDRGAGLSAGERQRLALARAFLRDAPVVLLDEPTASLDGATEAEVLVAVRRLMRGRTVVLVTHRPAVAALADRVFELGLAEVAA